MEKTVPPNDKRSFTRKIPDARWLAEMKRLQSALGAHGITQTRVGMELEFGLKDDGRNYEAIAEKHLGFLQEVSDQIDQAKSPEEKERLTHKLDQMANFQPREILMYELIEKEPLTKNMLEYSFGTGQLGSGYYDNPNVLEARLKHVPPEELCANHRIFMKELVQKAAEYGLTLEPKPTRHISVSFWTGQDNVMDLHSPRHTTTGAKITEGIARVMFDAAAVLSDPMAANFPEKIGIGSGRVHYFRMANERLEIRLPQNQQEYQHPEAVITLAMAGAVHGLDAHRKNALQGLVPAKPLTRIIFKQEGNDASHVLHLLNTMQQKPDGSRMLDTGYLVVALADIAAELRIIPPDGPVYDHVAHLSQQAVKSEKTTEPMLRDMCLQILDNLEGLDLKTGTDRGWPPGLEHLKGKIEPVGGFASFQIPFAYTQFRQKPSDSTYFITQSSALKDSLSPEMNARLRAAAEAEFGKPTHADAVILGDLSKTIVHYAAAKRGGSGLLAA